VRGAALAAGGAMLIVVMGPPAGARTVTGTFRAMTTVYAGCTLATANLVIPVSLNQTTTSVGAATFAVNCGAASFAHPMPIRFSFVPTGGVFSMTDIFFGRLLPYRLCNDSACTEVYVSGVMGPVVYADSSAFSYRLWGEAIPPPTGAQFGFYRQQVTVTLTY
jgi:hypothetical protein